MKKTILLCDEAREPKWRLQPPASGRLGLVGWRVEELPLDAGVPDEVTSLIARALTSLALVTFPSSSEPAGAGETVARLVEPAGARERVRSVLSREPSRFFLVSTRRPEMARALFDDPAFPWWQQGQVVILTPPENPAPSLDRRSVLSIIDGPGWPVGVDPSMTITSALIRPGVDGDVMGVVASTEGFERALRDSIQREAARSGFDCRSVDERRFAELLSPAAP